MKYETDSSKRQLSNARSESTLTKANDATVDGFIKDWDSGTETEPLRHGVAFWANIALMVATPLVVGAFGLAGMLFELLIWLLVLAVMTVLRYPRRQRRAIKMIAALENPRSVRPLMEGLVHPSQGIRKTAIIALSERLPARSEEIASRYTQMHRNAARSCLSSRDPSVVLAALRLVKELSDTEALDTVVNLRSRRGLYMRDARIIEYSIECEQHLRREKQVAVAKFELLRAQKEGLPRIHNERLELIRPITQGSETKNENSRQPDDPSGA